MKPNIEEILRLLSVIDPLYATIKPENLVIDYQFPEYVWICSKGYTCATVRIFRDERKGKILFLGHQNPFYQELSAAQKEIIETQFKEVLESLINE
jgi:hypothetical protein